MINDKPSLDALAHYAVKGMKWGVRRNRDTSDVTQVSKRKLKKKQVKNLDKNPDRKKNSKSVDDKVVSRLAKTKEVKTYAAYNKIIYDLNETAKSKGGKLWLTKAQADEYNRVYQNYVNKGKEYYNKYSGEYAGALLKDLGYRDTQEGREYLFNKGILKRSV